MLTVKERIWSSLLTIAGWTEVLFCELQWEFGLYLPVGLYQEPVTLGKKRRCVKESRDIPSVEYVVEKTVWQCFPFSEPKL